MTINTELLKMAQAKVDQAATLEKASFVDPATATGGGGAGAGVDPMAGAMPPMPAMGADPAAAGGDPAAMAGGAPPLEEGGGTGVTADEVRQIVQEAMMMQGGGAGGTGGAGGDGKMKVDVNTEIYHIKKLLTQIAGELGISIDPRMLLGDPANDPAIPNTEAAKDPDSAAASMLGGMPGSAISQIDPVQGASPALAGADAAKAAEEKAAAAFKLNHGQPFAVTGIQDTVTRAAALAAVINSAA